MYGYIEITDSHYRFFKKYNWPTFVHYIDCRLKSSWRQLTILIFSRLFNTSERLSIASQLK